MSDTGPVNDHYVWKVQGGAGIVSFPTPEAAASAIETLLEKKIISHDERKELSEWDRKHGTLDKIAEAKAQGKSLDTPPIYMTVQVAPQAKKHVEQGGSISYRIDVAKDKFEAAKEALKDTNATFIEAWPKHQELVFEDSQFAEVIATYLASTGTLPGAKVEMKTQRIQGIPPTEESPGVSDYNDKPKPVISVPSELVTSVETGLKEYAQQGR